MTTHPTSAIILAALIPMAAHSGPAAPPARLPWRVSRSADLPLAAAKALPGATVGSLAVYVGLDPAQSGLWLSLPPDGDGSVALANGRRLPLDQLEAGQELAAGQVLAVPNEILAVWLGPLGSVGQWIVDWRDDLQYLRWRGFRVEEWSQHDEAGHECRTDQCRRRGSTGGRWVAELRDAVSASSRGRRLHGLIVTAHGTGCGISDGGEASVSLNSLGHEYLLGFVLLNTCEAEQGLRYLASPNAAKHGLPGLNLMVPPVHIGHPREILRPGEQGTLPAPPASRRSRRAS